MREPLRQKIGNAPKDIRCAPGRGSASAFWWLPAEDSPSPKDAKNVATFDDAIAQLQEVKTLLERATSTRKKLMDFETRLASLESRRSTAMVTIMKSLACSDIEVSKSIPVTIEADGEEFIASFMDAGISSGGETIPEAFASLREVVATSFRTLADMPDSKLGPKMLRQKHVLLEFLCQHSPKSTPKISQQS